MRKRMSRLQLKSLLLSQTLEVHLLWKLMIYWDLEALQILSR